jgi:hypothetical protein
MTFTADLNPKSGKSMDLLDMVKMEDYLARSGKATAKPAAKMATPGADSVLKSDAMDAGVPFKFGNNYQSE